MNIVIIPAHLESSRLPHKLLLPGPYGHPLLWHTWVHAHAHNIDHVFIATDSSEIAEAGRRYNCKVIMTGQHHCGTDRVYEAYQIIQKQIKPITLIINLQADEPEIRPQDIAQLASPTSPVEFTRRGTTTLAVQFHDHHEFSLPQNVKVVFNPLSRRAIYFSRSTIPYMAKPGNLFDDCAAHKHIGVYAYTPEQLDTMVNLPRTRLEQLEDLEQMRLIEHFIPIYVMIVQSPDIRHDWPIGINTKDDYEAWLKFACA